MARCPRCFLALTSDSSRMNIHVESCPQGHGLVVNRGDLRRLVAERTMREMTQLIERGEHHVRPCPFSDGPLRSISFGAMPALGCASCGSLWFETPELKRHVEDVRRRTYGDEFPAAGAFAEDPPAFFPAETVAGILTDFELDLETPLEP